MTVLLRLEGLVALAFGIAAIWISHIGIDRLLGFGLKYPTGFGDTHLGGPASPGASE